MSDDQQDFLERQEARRRRMQQRLGQKEISGRAPLLAGQGNPEARRSSKEQAQTTGGQSGAAQPQAPAVPRASRAAQTRAARKTGSQEAAKQPAPAKNPGDQNDRSRLGEPEGRGATTRREGVARLAPLPQGPKPSLLARLIMWSTAAICGLLLLATIAEAWTVHRLNQQIAANQQAVDQLQAQNQALSDSVQQLQQPSTIEQEARKLGFIFPGDQPVIVVTTTPSVPPEQHPAPPAPGWWGFWPDWLKLFFGG